MEFRNRYDGVDAYAVTKIRYQARQLARFRAFHPSDIEDLEQELVLDLLRRLPAFDPSRASRNTFIARIVENRAASLIQAAMNASSIDTTLHPPPRSLAIRADGFDEWFDRVGPGSRLEYHRGHLTADRARGLSPFGEKLRREIDAIADRALTLAEEGRLLLVQRRHGDNDYGYFAIKPKKPTASRRWGGR